MNNNYTFSRFFSNVQETPWYQDFLSPVIQEISPKSKVLDVGTGSGKLIQRLFIEKSADCTGIDVKPEMLKEAEIKLNGIPAELHLIKKGEAFPFKEEQFDVICLCNVLFNLSEKDQEFVLKQCLNVLKENGKIVVLNPSGKASFPKVVSKFFKRKNKSIGIWYSLTKTRAKDWNAKKSLELFSEKHHLAYSKQLVFDGLAQLELLKS